MVAQNSSVITQPKNPKDIANDVLNWGKSVLNQSNKNAIPHKNTEAPRSLNASTAELSRYGLKTPAEVIAFLKSPAGETVRTEILQHIQEELFQKEEQKAQAIEHNRLMHRLLAFFFLLLMSKESDAAEYIKTLTEQANTNTLKEAKKAMAASAPLSAAQQEITQVIKHYETAIMQIDTQLSQVTKQKNTLLAKGQQLAVQQQQIAQKYNTYAASINHFVTTGQANINHISQQMNHLSEQRNGINHEIIMLRATGTQENEMRATALLREQVSLDRQITQLRDDMPNKIMEEIERLTGVINEKVETVANLLTTGNETDEIQAMALVNEQNAINLQIAMLHDLRDTFTGRKYFMDAEGNSVDSIEKAYLVLEKNQKIVKDNGKFYLLEPHQEWDDVKESQTALNEANLRYEDEKPKLMGVKQVVERNQTLEEGFINEQIDSNKEQLLVCEKEETELNNQRNLLDSAKANAQTLLNNPDALLQPITTPSFSRPSGVLTQLPTPSPATDNSLRYKKEYNQLTINSKVTPEQLRTIVANAGLHHPDALQQLNTIFTTSRLNNTTPIPPTTMKSILENMPRFALNAYKPNVTNVSQPRKEEPTPDPKTPTPFKMTPQKF